MKLIVLVVGAALGFGGGIWYGVQHPEWAKDFSSKEDQWVQQGKDQAWAAVRTKLDTMITQQQSTTASVPGARSFAGGIGGGTSAPSNVDALKALKSDLATQLNQPK